MTNRIKCPGCWFKNPLGAVFCNKCGKKIDPQTHSPGFKGMTQFVDRENSEEFTQTLLGNGSIQGEGDKYVFSGGTEEELIPDTLQEIMSVRLGQLEDNLKRTMQVASVMGRDFAFRLLQSITGMREGLDSSLSHLKGMEFIYEKALFPELECVFKYARLQELAHNSLLHERRKEIHEKIGKAIEEVYTSRLEEFYEMLIYHYSKSGNHKKAYQYQKLSNEKAQGISETLH